MLAAVYYGPHDLRLEERPAPAIGSADALLKVVSTGICGTDLRIFHGAHRKYAPGIIRIPGHEVVGEIAEIGPEVKGYSVGQRVFVAPNFGCGYCVQCISGNNNRCLDYGGLGVTVDGTFAEYLHIPAAAIRQGNLIPIAEDADPAAAAMIEPFACVLRGQEAVKVQVGDVVLIIGAGPIGVMHIMLARLRGASRVIVSELIEMRRVQALQAGANRVVNPVEEDLAGVVFDESGGTGADVVIVAAPAPAAQVQALQLAAIGGRINFFGGLPKDRPIIEADANAIHYKELWVTGTTGCSTGDCRRAAAIVNAGQVNLAHLVSGRFPLRAVLEAFAAAEQRTSLKIVIEP